MTIGGKDSGSRVKEVLDDYATLPDLQALQDAGCNRTEIVVALSLAFLADSSWKQLLGVDLRAFKRAIRNIRICADAIEKLNRSELVYRLSIEHRDTEFVGVHEYPTLPGRLRHYAGLLDHRRHLLGPKRNVRGHAWKAWIVAIVTEDTGHPHDREVASLIAAILKVDKYSEKAHQAWRLKSLDFIEIMRTKLKNQRANRRLLPEIGLL
jgi:hypothetical protein